ncbi:class F sortase [Streptomyces sp. XM4193]|uniref:class F sortase n=1 Tax=Streptomyces sp. XM4193 TaxID=2929782 RepID=UPI001FF7D9C1|nr:class F sortase [Streptomyces sp. XM4193]MCK1798520.1 class F sortase [Streptomyces sp. XM4193]
MAGESQPSGGGRLITATAWLVLLLGLWLWGKDLTDSNFPVLGELGSGRSAESGGLPDALDPVEGGRPVAVRIDGLGVDARVQTRGLDADGAVDAPPLSQGDDVAWYGGGPQPGAAGAALLVGHVDTATDKAVFFNLSSADPGTKVRVSREDGTVAEFTVEDVEVVQREGFDPAKAYGERNRGRAELRLITCGGTFDRESRSYTANVVVSAYLTAIHR